MKSTAERIAADGTSQRWYERLLEHSLQDLIAMYMPHLALCSASFIWACYIYDPSLRLLLYFELPERYQSWLTFTVCFVEEIRFFLVVFGVGSPMLQLQVISFDQVNTHLETIMFSVLNRYYLIKKSMY